jgi:putative transposase
MTSNKLGSYAVAGREVMPGVEHRRHKGLNNRAKFPPADPTTRKDHEALQVSAPVSAFRLHDPITDLFHFPRHALSSSDHRDLRSTAIATWPV